MPQRIGGPGATKGSAAPHTPFHSTFKGLLFLRKEPAAQPACHAPEFMSDEGGDQYGPPRRMAGRYSVLTACFDQRYFTRAVDKCPIILYYRTHGK